MLQVLAPRTTALQAGKNAAAPAVEQPAAAAPAAGNGRKLDVKDLKFKVVTEFVGNQSQMARAISGFGWGTKQHGDCSHGMGHYSGYFFQVSSPELTYSEESFKQISDALTALKNCGAQLGDRTGALKILVCSDKGQIDIDTLREVYRMHQSIDPIMYSLGQNGNGYHVGQHSINTTAPQLGSVVDSKCPSGNYYFCEPTSNNPDLCKNLVSAKSVSDLENALTRADRYGYSGKHWGFLPRNRSNDSKFCEFRYFTNTFDGDAVRADVEAALGILKCAHEGRWPQDLPHQTMGSNQAPQVDWRVWNAFNAQVMSGLKGDVVQKYFAAGKGTVAPPPVTKADVERLGKMQGDGYGFEWGGGNLEKALGAATVKVTEPGQNFSYDVPGADFLKYMAAETGGGEAQTKLASSLAARQQELRAEGVRFFATGGTQPITSLHGPAGALEQGKLEAEVGGNRVALADRDAFENFAYQVLGAKYPAELRHAAEAAVALRAKGYEFSNAAGDKKIISPLGMVRALAGKGIGIKLPDSKKTNKFQDSAAAAEFIAAESGDLAALPEDKRTVMALAADLRTTGYEFSHADKAVDAKAQLLVPQALADGKLQYKAPGGNGTQAFKGGDFVHWAGATLGREGAITMADKQLLTDWQRLQNGGAQLTDASGNQSQRSLLSQVLAGETVYVKLPGEQPRAFANGGDLSAFVHARNDMPGSLDAAPRTALQRLEKLRDERGINVNLNGVPLTTMQQVAWALTDRHSVSLSINGAGSALPVADFDNLQYTMAAETNQHGELPEDAQRLLDNLSKLESKHVQLYSNGTPLGWKTQQMGAVKDGSMRAKLPSRVWWKLWPRKDIKIKSEADLAKLAHKMAKK
jgi:hypothetical protein